MTHPDPTALAEAIEWMQALQGLQDARLEPDQSKVQRVITAARLYLALEPHIRAMVEARAMATGGQWESAPSIRENVAAQVFADGISICELWQSNKNRDNNAAFFAVAANHTAEIAKIMGDVK